MNKIVASVGLVALGASGLQSASAQVLGSPDSAKPWSVAATLRGFYDDNTATVPDNAATPPGSHRYSFGYQITPSANFVLPLDTTTFNLGLLYSYKYYENIPPGSTEHADQTFTFNGGVQHTFSERLKAAVSDSFVIGQEPDMLRAGSSFATFQRITGNNIRNFGSVSVDGQITPKLGFGLGYDNAYYNYEATAADAGIPSPSGTLDRIENRVHGELTWLLGPVTKALVGYQFTHYSYTGDEPIGFGINGPVMSNSRNLREHTFYAGAEHAFLEQLVGSVRAGGSYTDFYNDPTMNPSWSPYANVSLRYNYAVQSFVEGGLSYDHSATDIVGLNPLTGSFTTDSEAFTIYATATHRITPYLFGNITGQFQNSYYNGGTMNGESEQYYLVGLSLEYRFTPNISTHVGYNYDKLQSPANILNGFPGGRSFDRNRVYIGVTASY